MFVNEIEIIRWIVFSEFCNFEKALQIIEQV